MLLPTMTEAEVYTEVMRDHKRLEETTLPRLYNEYYKERQKLKIDKAKDYPKTYRVKTAAKNNWLIVLTKDADHPRYHSPHHCQVDAIVYYFGKDGYEFYRTYPGKCPDYFYGHFFTRYNERMGLNLNNHVDIAAHFFANNKVMMKFPNDEEGEHYIAAICKAGFLLGIRNENPNWKIYKTFVSHEIKHDGQKEREQKLQQWLSNNIYLYIRADIKECKRIKSSMEQIFGKDHHLVKKLNLATSANGMRNTILADGSTVAERSREFLEKVEMAKWSKIPGHFALGRSI